MANTDNIIAFQGAHGAYSDLACRNVFPELMTLPCRTFEDAFAAIRDGKAGRGMIPIENSIAGRVADIHHLLPGSGLHIIGEHFQRVNHHLMAIKGASLDAITHVHSHVHALSQCRNIIRKLKIEPVVHVDTAGAAAELAETNDSSQAVIASELAAQLHGLEILAGNIEDADHNTTRFLVMTREPQVPPVGEDIVMTSFVFRVRNVAAALYKALGGFASNGINMTKLESYLVGGYFHAAQFFVEVEGHPQEPGMKDALEELGFFSHEVRILGTYPAHPYRLENAPPKE
ncbi:MAG: prephenate dehydratase [Rhodospirillales bacterium]|jgi:prephenate dehydratase